jgi:hypothetical protein
VDLPTVLSSAVVAGLVAGLVTLRISERKIAIENITQQRQLWREKIRSLSLKIKGSYKSGNKDELNSQYIEMQLLLNPEDSNDKSILDTIWEMIEETDSTKLHIILSEKLSLLLKHDWERAKLEAEPVWYRFKKVKRISYEKSKFKRIGS